MAVQIGYFSRLNFPPELPAENQSKLRPSADVIKQESVCSWRGSLS